MRYILIIWSAGGRLWILLPVSGMAVFERYSAFRARHEGVLSIGDLVVSLPSFDPWWIYGFAAICIWVLAGFARIEAKRVDSAPRVLFEKPFIEEFLVQEWGPTVIKSQRRIQMAKIIVRNNPINREQGREAKDAHAMATFYRSVEDEPCLVMNYPRWTENDKPRPDTTPNYLPVPRFKHEWNFRTLSPNNSANTIDFAFRDTVTGMVYAFEGSSQESPLWQNPSLKLDGKNFRVCLTIQAAGMRQPEEHWLILKVDDPGKCLRVFSAESMMWKNWVGVG